MLRNDIREVCSGQDGHCWGLLGISSVVWIQSLVQSGNEYLVMVSRMQTFHPKIYYNSQYKYSCKYQHNVIVEKEGKWKGSSSGCSPA